MTRGWLVLYGLAFVVAVAGVSLGIRTVDDANASRQAWRIANVTAYATFERFGPDRDRGLTGCPLPLRDVRPPKGQTDCETANGEWLDDTAHTIATNFLPFGTRVEILKWAGGRMWRCRGRVNDRTGSSFGMEFSYALALCTGSGDRSHGWDSPRYVSWRVVR